MVKNLPASAEDARGVGSIPGWGMGAGNSNWSWKWQPTPVFLPGEFHGHRSLAGYSPLIAESEMTEQLTYTYIVTLHLRQINKKYVNQ